MGCGGAVLAQQNLDAGAVGGVAVEEGVGGGTAVGAVAELLGTLAEFHVHAVVEDVEGALPQACLLYTSPSPRDS